MGQFTVLFDLLDDTIAAVSSPPGFAERGIVRCTGPRVLELAAATFAPASTVDWPTVAGHRRLFGDVALEPDCRVPGELYIFRAPRSYTRQDCLEFHLPGSPVLLAMLLERLLALGARPAQPGEFTARAFLAGAMDLTRTEAVAAIIHARSDAQLRAAQRLRDGRLTHSVDAMMEELAELVALIEADIDFAEEPIDFITPLQLRDRLDRLAGRLQQMLDTAQSTERFDLLPRILLVGRSNAGKSTLLNRLSGIDRALCSPIAGTTRDLLSAPIKLRRTEALLVDAAGVDPAVDDELMHLTRTATLAAAARADLVCLVLDVTAPLDPTDLSLGAEVSARRLLLANKIDLLDDAGLAERRRWLERHGHAPFCLVSAQTGAGLDHFRELLYQSLHLEDAPFGDETILLTARQQDALRTAHHAIARARQESAEISATLDRADVLAFELREALECLGSITGSVTTEDLLGRVFASFCIGK